MPTGRPGMVAPQSACLGVESLAGMVSKWMFGASALPIGVQDFTVSASSLLLIEAVSHPGAPYRMAGISSRSSRSSPMTFIRHLSRPALVALAIGEGGCSFDIENPNTPDVIGENPTRSEVAATANGILIATRADVGLWALVGGILGREAY